MQDEVLKHTQKIYKAAKSGQHSFGEKIREIVIEIGIIVFAVTLSIWLHGWSEHRHQKNEAEEFLRDVNDDLAKDFKTMSDRKESLSRIFTSYSQIIKLLPKQLDTAHNININFTLNTFKANDGNYEGFKSSGKIGYIENKELKKSILEYYQEVLPVLYDVDKYHYAKHLEVWEMINSSESFSSPALRAKIILDVQITDALIKANNNAITNAREIQKEIDKELSE